MKENLTATRLLVSFDNLNNDKSRNEQTILELALKYEIIPLSKFEKETLHFDSDDIVSVAFLNDLMKKGYNNQFILAVALLFNITSTYDVPSTIYYFESSTGSDHSLYNFLSELLVLGFNMTYQIIS